MTLKKNRREKLQGKTMEDGGIREVAGRDVQ